MCGRFFLLFFLSLAFVVSLLGQKKEREVPEIPQMDSRTERREEPVIEQPRQDKPIDLPKEEPKRETPRSSDNSSNDSKREERNSRSSRRGEGEDSERKRSSKRHDNSDEESKGRRKDRDNKRDKEKDKEEDKNKKSSRDGRRYPTPTPPTFPPVVIVSRPKTSVDDYFDADDVFFNIYESFIDSDPNNYSPYFESILAPNYQPLYYIYGREFFFNEHPFISDEWTVYYEPSLGEIFVDFNKFGQVKYKKMVWFAVGDSYKKVANKVKYKGQTVRPVLVETLPAITSNKVYSFNVKDLPKGEYEMRFIAKDGSTLKHQIRLK